MSAIAPLPPENNEIIYPRYNDRRRLDVMNFLNEAAEDYPHAISFGSGRPCQRFFDLGRMISSGAMFPPRGETPVSQRAIFPDELGQYGRTAGVIGDLIAKQVYHDEGITCDASQVFVTTGCQEAMALCIQQICSTPQDVLLLRSPTYIGASGAAIFSGVEIRPVSWTHAEDICAQLAETCQTLLAEGKRPKALYLIPEFDNPTGESLNEAIRLKVISTCVRYGVTILEDNPYGMFRYEGAPTKPMYALSNAQNVVYLGTFSKTLCPSLRVGFAILPKGTGGPFDPKALAISLSQAKSFGSLNTSQIAQAIVGGVLLEQGCSLARRIAPAREHYRRNRDAMLEALDQTFSPGRSDVTWNTPEGGFFLTLTLPRPFLRHDMEVCARDHGALVMPLSFFAFDNAQDNRVRFAFSNVDIPDIREGVKRFATYLALT